MRHVHILFFISTSVWLVFWLLWIWLVLFSTAAHLTLSNNDVSVRNDACKNSLLTWSLCIWELFIIVTATVISRHMTFYDSSDVSRNVPHSFILIIGYELRCPSSQHGIEYLNIPVTSNGFGLFDNHLAHVFNYPLFTQPLSQLSLYWLFKEVC